MSTPAPKLAPGIRLERLTPGVDYWTVWLDGERIGDVRGTTSGDPGLPALSQREHATRNEAANACLHRYLTRPYGVSCLWCRSEETTYFLMQNHGGGHGIHHGHCIAQALTRNHVRYDADLLDPTSDTAKRNRSRKFDHANAVRNLARSVERAAELWDHLDPDWLRDARELLARHQALEQPPVEHHAVPTTEEAALW